MFVHTLLNRHIFQLSDLSLILKDARNVVITNTNAAVTCLNRYKISTSNKGSKHFLVLGPESLGQGKI